MVNQLNISESTNKNDTSIQQDSDRHRTDDIFKLTLKPISWMKKVKSHSEPRRNIFNEDKGKKRFTSEGVKKAGDYQHPAIFQSRKLDK